MTRKQDRLQLQDVAVAEIAQRFWDAHFDIKANAGSGRTNPFFGLKVVGVRPAKDKPGHWRVQFSASNPAGAVIDSPPFVLVCDETNEARFEEF